MTYKAYKIYVFKWHRIQASVYLKIGAKPWTLDYLSISWRINTSHKLYLNEGEIYGTYTFVLGFLDAGSVRNDPTYIYLSNMVS